MSGFVRKTIEEVRQLSDQEVIAYYKELRAVEAAQPQTDESRQFIAKLDAACAAFEKTVEEERLAIQKMQEATHVLAISEDKLRDCLKKVAADQAKSQNMLKAYLMLSRVSPAAAIQFLIAVNTPEKP